MRCGNNYIIAFDYANGYTGYIFPTANRSSTALTKPVPAEKLICERKPEKSG